MSIVRSLRLTWLNVSLQSDKILALTNAANVELEPIWATLLAKALEGKNVKDLLSNVGGKYHASTGNARS